MVVYTLGQSDTGMSLLGSHYLFGGYIWNNTRGFQKFAKAMVSTTPNGMCQEPTIIDSHLHVWASKQEASTFPYLPGQEPQTEGSADFLLEKMSDAGVAGALIVQPINHKFDHSYVSSVLRKYPQKFAGCCLGNPHQDGHGIAELERLVKQEGYRAVRFNPYLWPSGQKMNNDIGKAMFAKAGELKIPVGFMCFKGLALHIHEIECLCSLFPSTTVLMDHFGFCKPPVSQEEIAVWNSLLNLARHPQVYVKVSAFFRISRETFPYKDTWYMLRQLLDVYGAHRVMWGSDFPFVNDECGYVNARITLHAASENGYVSDDELKWLLGNTARVRLWRHEALAAEDFAKIVGSSRPVVFHGLVKNWQACEKWDPAAGGLQHLKTISGESVVQAMLSKDPSTFYGDIRSHERIEMPFGEFLDMASISEHNEHVYLAQVPIHVKYSKEKPPLSSLASGISMPEFLDADEISNINFWMSCTSSRSSIHYDPYHNVLAVVSGQKEVTVWPPSAAPYLYPMPLHGEASNHSQVNFVQPDYERFPRFKEASQHSQTATLNAGDAIFIPEGWFHQVNSGPLTIAVNFWWPSKVCRAFNTHMDAYYLRRILTSLLDAEKEAMLGRNCVVEKETYDQDNCKLDDLSVECLTAYETSHLHTILSWTASIVDTHECTLPQEDAIANVFANISPLSLRRILLIMVLKFPRTLEALVLHGLSPVAAELLTHLFEQMDSIASESSQSEFYKMFYSVFDDSQVAMGVLLDKKEEFASKALKSVMDKFLNLSF